MNVFIAGGSSNLGRSVIKVFKDRGDSVTATCCTKAPGTDVQWIQMDVTDPASVSRAFEAVDRIDCLISLFGVFTEDVRDWEKVFDINV
ncbi:MAG: NAD-dependent epimerase/dehydratase family protein, partial [Sphaerochaetaceae bacterium]